MALLENHLEQISLSAAAIAELPFPPPKKFTNALLRSKDITALIRDTEVHERALFKAAPSEPPNPPIYQSLPRRSTAYSLNSDSENFSNNTRLLRTGRQHPAVATLLGGELGDQLRIEGSQAGKERGEVDSRFNQLTASIGRYESRVSKRTTQLSKMTRRAESNEDGYATGPEEQLDTDPGNAKPEELPITVDELEKEEQDIRELERKKQALEERVSGMERDLGGPTSAIIAFKTNVEVTVVDINHDRISAWQSDTLPIYEPGLHQIVQAVRDGVPAGKHHTAFDAYGRPATTYPIRPKLFFSTDVDRAIVGADLIFVCVNTPTKSHGIGKGSAADLDFVEAATRTIARVATQDKIVVEKSTVPCRTAQSIREILAANAHPGVRFDVLSNPEFLAEGTAVQNLLHPDRIIIGSLPTPAGYRAAASLAEVYEQWIPRERIITMNLWSSELSKLAANAMLAQRISSVNALSAICEATGADVDEVSYACGLDSRIGPQMLKAGPGFGGRRGHCFQKDIFNIVYLSESLHLYEIADYWRAIINMNEHQKERFTKRIISCLYNNLAGKKLAVLGFAFKKDTSDTRESPAITLVSNFVAERARVAIYDPQVPERQIWHELADNGCNPEMLKRNVSVCKSAYVACEGADAVVIATEWDEFSNKATVAVSVAKENQQPLVDPNFSWYDCQYISSEGTNHEVSSSSRSRRDAATSFQVPARKSAGVVIKDPKNGEIKTLNVQRSSSGSSSLQSSIANSANFQSPPRQSRGLTLRDPNILPVEPVSFPRTFSGNLLASPTSLNLHRPAETKQALQIAASSIDERLRANEIAIKPVSAGKLDWARIASKMRKPMFVFDGRNLLDHGKLEALGFRVEAIGKRGTVTGE
ncbi:MAG: hypothetical protein Q9225_001644 [Loekoesia sp. 1 TL-2023]